MTSAPPVKAKSSAPKTAVRLDDVRFRWRRGVRDVLDVTSLEIRQGETVFIKGPSGSGKSTLLNLIAGVVVPETGQVWLGDAELTSLSGARRDRLRADRVGFIFQLFNLIPYLSVTENVTLPLLFSKQRQTKISDPVIEAERLLGRLGLAREVYKRSVTDLSIGQQQRVAAARALIGSPPLLIADEPTSALDYGTRESFIRLLFEECALADMTLLFVSHDSSLEGLFGRSLDLTELNRAGA